MSYLIENKAEFAMKRFGVLVFVIGLCVQVEAQFPFALSDTGYGVSVASDPNGRVLLLDAFSEPVDFDPGPGDATVSPTGSDGYLAFYSEDGFFLEVLVLRAIVRKCLSNNSLVCR